VSMTDAVLLYPDESDADLSDGSRAAKKAQTRSELRAVAQQLFAERGFDAVTIANIAAAASVSVQTVFNHFTNKEELFFDGRVSWVDGPAAAVRHCGAAVPPLAALRQHLAESVRDRVGFEATPEGCSYTAAIDGSPTLSSRERELVYEAERRLADALADAWADEAPGGVTSSPPRDPRVVAALTAATWLATVRVLITARRQERDIQAESPSRVAALTDRLLSSLEASQSWTVD
jgi:AcrR family transcriptional regulator